MTKTSCAVNKNKIKWKKMGINSILKYISSNNILIEKPQNKGNKWTNFNTAKSEN